MNADLKEAQNKQHEKFRRTVASKEKRRIRAGKKGTVGAWTAFGSMGVVGWFVALPTFLGSLFGAWLDYNWPSKISWTLTMLGAGLFTGCVFAGIWMNREKNKIIKEREEWEAEEKEQEDDK
ncbi:AtpZ/AtpI family protein [Maridesulfovibrio hydrothermalis]|uniref:F0F1-ATPase subunit n=1 Tax=Maridesulfovibrio hydrothermalis AM13 = DSM 14728 TaxID=1121451 RepID=L0REZ3_9BACT|nr:AtpZ/AtpI family protein [Maridesulfovibrio hydrothermalis]CCO24770.1 F0F1-ATPase subunit [Maridesulfovibrio hydrothermalis AM13 = DSM 14728]